MTVSDTRGHATGTGLVASDITVDFGGVRAVDGLDVSIEQGGSTLGIVGPNGSGKTTFLNAITGVVPAKGELVMAGGRVPLGRPRATRASGIVRTFQAPQTFLELSCLENLLLSSSQRKGTGIAGAWFGRPRMWREERARIVKAESILDRVGLGPIGSVPSDTLTYGQQRLLELARALAADPIVLLLDEPAAGLNASESKHLADLLKSIGNDGISFILVEHKIDFVTYLCERVMVLELGRLVAEGPPDLVWQDPHVIEAYLGRVSESDA